MNRNDILDLCKQNELSLVGDMPENINCRKDKFVFIDKYGYKYFLTLDNLKDKRSGHAIVKKNNPFSLYNIQNYINLNKGKAIVLSQKWQGEKSKIKLLCSCGNEFEVIWYHIYAYKKFQCNKCGYSLNGAKKEKSLKEANRICEKHNCHIINETFKNRKHFDLMDKNGYKYSDCSVFALSKNVLIKKRFSCDNKYTKENIELFVKLNNKLPKTYYSQCQSNLEKVVMEYLNKKNIQYTQQQTFNWCKRKKCLPFDFYLPAYNICIEVNGKQHYKPLEYFGGEERFNIQVEVDNFKKECCKNNSVLYVEISYKDIENDDYKQKIDNIID